VSPTSAPTTPATLPLQPPPQPPAAQPPTAAPEAQPVGVQPPGVPATASQPAAAPVSQPLAAPTSAPAAALTVPSPAQLAATQTAPASSQAESAPASSQAAKRRLTLDDLYGSQPIDFDGEYARGMRWLDEQHFLHQREGRLMRVDALTDAAQPAYDDERLKAALLASGYFDEMTAERIARQPAQWTNDRSAALFQHQDRLYIYRFADGRLTRLTQEARPRREVVLGPGGRFVVFVRDHNLYSIDTQRSVQRQLTRDGSPTLLNGILDWVYQEEVYGRGDWRGFWISPDEQFVAYLQLDESRVPQFPIVHQVTTQPSQETTYYPKAGDPNPVVRLGVAPTTGGRTVWVDLPKHADTDILIVRVSWSPDGKLICSVQDREQRWLDLNEADPKTGRARTLVTERSPAWVENLPHPHWLPDGSFLWRSARDGWQHLYHYARDGRLIRRLTGGDWEVRAVHGVDAAGLVYFDGTRDSVLERHAYRTPLRGGPVERLTEPGYTHRASFSPMCTYFFDTFSNITTPTKVHLRRGDGTLVRVVSDNALAELEQIEYRPPEFVRFAARDGFPLTGLLIRPVDFDPQRRYPVWCSVYGGPGSQTVWNRWGGQSQMYYHWLAQDGVIVWLADPRSASGRGAVASWQAYRRLGRTELADIEDGVRWLIERGWADPQRIGITGHSYGGYMTCYALTHSTLFSLGVAGAPVTDWRHYDTIYTERYMRTPVNNPRGYETSSVVAAAKDLHGRLLIAHGLIDDNVHFTNTAQLVNELEKHNKLFDLMLYPRDRHGIGAGGEHLRALTLEQVRERLLRPESQSASE